MEVNIDWNKFDSTLYRPLVEMPIPDFNPGTLAYDDFWDEQDNRCLNGYKPSRFMPSISNEHYFYLNMCKIELLKKGATRKSYDYPFYRELDRRLFDEIKGAKRHKHGLIVGKPRRVGLSWVGATTSTYELLFYKNGKIGVAAGQDDKAQDFYEKVKALLDNVRPEYASGIITKNSEEIKLGYKYIDNKQPKEGGLLSQMFMKTMYAKPTGFEGKSLALVIFEEAGLFADIVAAFKSTEPCFKDGSNQFGTPIVYGTGGDIEKGSKGYKKMWYADKDVYNLKKVFISATDFYPGDGIPDKETKKTISFFDFRTGRTNHKAARIHIEAEREAKKNSEGFVKHIQSYPLKESEIFIKNSGGLLNRQKLNAQRNNLENCPYLIQTGRLEWTTKDPTTLRLIARAKNIKEEDKIHFQRGSKIKFIEDEELGTIKKLLDPVDQKKVAYNPDIIGCDSYDDEVAEGTGSLGATIVYRCFHGVTHPYNMPIAYVMDRGTSDNDDEFYSNTLRLAIYYDSEVLLEWTKILIKTHFEDVGALQHLKGRPDLSGEGYNSKAVNQYGFKMSNQHAFKIIVRLLKKEVNENFNNIWFEEILDHLIDFGDANADLASAYGMVLISRLDSFGDLTDGIDEDTQYEGDILDNMGHWVIEDGIRIFKTYAETQDYDDGFDQEKINVWNPEYDLSGEDKKSYEQAKVSSINKIKKEREDILKKYGNDPMAFVLEQHHNKLNEN